jgi:hypothetical protein
VQSGEQSLLDAAQESANHYAGLACSATFCAPFDLVNNIVNLATNVVTADNVEDAVAGLTEIGLIGATVALPDKLPGIKNKPTKVRGGCHSFSASTPVVLADGTTKPIAAVQVGDVVLATDPNTGETSAETVTATWVHDDILVDLSVGDKALTTTEDHLFWNATDEQWQEAQDFDPGDALLTPTGDTVTVTGVAWTTTHVAPAYNLTVEHLHTYYAVAGVTPVLVHNTDGCPVHRDGATPEPGDTCRCVDEPFRRAGERVEDAQQAGEAFGRGVEAAVSRPPDGAPSVGVPSTPSMINPNIVGVPATEVGGSDRRRNSRHCNATQTGTGVTMAEIRGRCGR